MGDPEGSSGADETGARRGGDVVELTDSNAISRDQNRWSFLNLLFLGLGDVGLVLKVSS